MRLIPKAILASFMTMGFLSCAGMRNLPRPEPARDERGRFTAARDGTNLFVYDASPPSYERTVFLLSGITGIDHRRETEVIDALSAGVNRVVVIHPRGTGYSEGKRGDTRDFSVISGDYADVINADESGGKRILYGHSMSCAMAIEIASRAKNLAGVILVNPPVILKEAEGMTPGFLDYAKYAAYMVFAPHVPIVNMAGNPGSIKNPEERKEAEERSDDPLLVKFFSMYCMLESKKLMDSMGARAKSCTVPLLLVYGTADGIIEKSGCDSLFSSWASPDKEFVAIEGGPHGKATVLAAAGKIGEWIGRR